MHDITISRVLIIAAKYEHNTAAEDDTDALESH